MTIFEYVRDMRNHMNERLNVPVEIAYASSDECELSVLRFHLGGENLVRDLDITPEAACVGLAHAIECPRVEVSAPFILMMDNRLDALYAIVVNSALDTILDPTKDADFLLKSLKTAIQRPLYN